MAKQRNEYTPSSFGRCKREQRLISCLTLGVVMWCQNPFANAAYGQAGDQQSMTTSADAFLVLPTQSGAGATAAGNELLIVPAQSSTGSTSSALAATQAATSATGATNEYLIASPTHPVTGAVAPPPAEIISPPTMTPPSQELLRTARDVKAMQAARPRNTARDNAATAAATAHNPLPNELSPSAGTVSVPVATESGALGGQPSTFGTAHDPAFQNMTKKMYPMSPEQIQALRDADLRTQRAIAGAAPVGTPTPTLSSQTVSLSPGSVPPVIRLSTGYVSSVVFVDETGAPWPVGAYSIGDPTSFNIQWDTKSNLLLIQGQKPYATGNMAVRLQDMPTPVMLTLVTDQQNVDYRIDFRVQGRGPHAQASIIGSSLPQNADAILMNLLEGVPPQGSQPLHIVGGPAEGWLQGNTLYLRTALTILSPAWVKTMTSADGTKVYQFSATPMILASQGGQPLTLRIEGL